MEAREIVDVLDFYAGATKTERFVDKGGKAQILLRSLVNPDGSDKLSALIESGREVVDQATAGDVDQSAVDDLRVSLADWES